jgi:hypothetical protein
MDSRDTRWARPMTTARRLMGVRYARGVMAALTLGLAIAAVAQPAAAAAKQPKPGKWKPTVITVKQKHGGIAPGDVQAVDAKCPSDYDVIGGSYIIGGNSVMAHAAGAVPFYSQGLYRTIIVNPPTGPFLRAQDASVTVAAICAAIGTPVVVKGAFPDGPPSNHPGGATSSPIPSGLASTVSTDQATDSVPNQAAHKVDAACHSTKDSVFSGGYTLSNAVFAQAPISAVLSKIAAFSATVVNPGVNPALGVAEEPAVVRVTAMCARSGQPIVVNADASPAVAHLHTAQAAKTKPKKNKHPKSHKLHGTVVLRTTSVKGITAGTIKSADVKCPRGYSVFGGSYLIGGNSVLAHTTVAAVLSKTNSYSATVVNPPVNINTGVPRSTATLTVAANCARNATPIVVNGPFK